MSHAIYILGISNKYRMDEESLNKFLYEAFYKKHNLIKDEWIQLLHKQPLESFGIIKRILIFDKSLYEVSLDYSGNYALYECNNNGFTHRCICYG